MFALVFSVLNNFPRAENWRENEILQNESNFAAVRQRGVRCLYVIRRTMRNVQAQNIINSNVAPVNSAALDCDDNDGDATMRDDSRAECILKEPFRSWRALYSRITFSHY